MDRKLRNTDLDLRIHFVYQLDSEDGPSLLKRICFPVNNDC